MKRWNLGMLIRTFRASLLGNILADEGVIRAVIRRSYPNW